VRALLPLSGAGGADVAKCAPRNDLACRSHAGLALFCVSSHRIDPHDRLTNLWSLRTFTYCTL
jgi:hypothetical protein